MVSANVKILIITSYLLFIGSYTWITASIVYRHWLPENRMQVFTNYFVCESTGLQTCDRSEIDDYATPQLLGNVVNILLALFTGLNILYAWNYRDIKRIMRKHIVAKTTTTVNRTKTTDIELAWNSSDKSARPSELTYY